MIASKGMEARLRRLEALMGGDAGAGWLLLLQPHILHDEVALAAALAAHRAETGHAGKVVVGVETVPSVEEWAARYGAAAGRA